MYSFPYLEPVCCSMSSSNCCFLTCIQISQEVGKVVWYICLLKNFPQFIVIYTVNGFGIVNKAEVDVFLELYCFLDDTTYVHNLISGSSAFSKSSLNIWNFIVHVPLNPDLKFLSVTFLACEMRAIVHSLALPFWGLEWKLIFSSPVATVEFSKCAGILNTTLSQHHLLGF